jgi:hypothetical protein
MNDSTPNRADSCRRMAALSAELHSTVSSMYLAYEESGDRLNDVQPEGFSECCAHSLDEWALRLSGMADAWRAVADAGPADWPDVTPPKSAPDLPPLPELGKRDLEMVADALDILSPCTALDEECARDLAGAFRRRAEAMAAAGNAAMLDGLDPGFRFLVEEKGFEPEIAGGGAVILSRYADGGGYVWVTQSEGAGLPRPESWHVCAYSSDPDADLPLIDVRFDEGGGPWLGGDVDLRRAVEAALIMAGVR